MLIVFLLLSVVAGVPRGTTPYGTTAVRTYELGVYQVLLYVPAGSLQLSYTAVRY